MCEKYPHQHPRIELWDPIWKIPAKIDTKIVPLIESLWKLGIQTRNSCESNISCFEGDEEKQDDPSGYYIWIQFETLSNFCHFMDLISQQIDHQILLMIDFNYDLLLDIDVLDQTDFDSMSTSSHPVSVRFLPKHLDKIVSICTHTENTNFHELYERGCHDLAAQDDSLMFINEKQHLQQIDGVSVSSMHEDNITLQFSSCFEYEQFMYVLQESVMRMNMTDYHDFWCNLD